jgi:hypothetical protein
MYSSTGVGKLSESQKSKLRNGHPVRIKLGSGNTLNLTDQQIKKLQSAHKKGAAYTITFHPEQAEKHGSGFFGDIASRAKAFAKKQIVSNKDLINPIINRVKSGVHGGIDSLSNKAKAKLEELASKANAKVDQYIQPIEGEGVKRRRGRPKKGEGIIGDALKGLIGMSGLGVVKPKRLQKGKGIMSTLLKAVAGPIIDAAAGAAKSKVSTIGSGAKKRKAGRPKGRGGGALFPAGTYGPGD